MKKVNFACVTFIAMLLLVGCTVSVPKGSYRVHGENYKLLTSSSGFSETGLASWYGKKFHGRLTASGAIYDMYGRTAAHKTLPLGTRVKVTRLDNGLTVTAKINDRGPFIEGRIIDLTKTLAEELDMIASGTARVRVEAIDSAGRAISSSAKSGAVSWQVGSFRDGSNADALKSRLSRDFDDVRVVSAWVDGERYQRVYVGRYNQTRESDSAYSRLTLKGLRPIPAHID